GGTRALLVRPRRRADRHRHRRGGRWRQAGRPRSADAPGRRRAVPGQAVRPRYGGLVTVAAVNALSRRWALAADGRAVVFAGPGVWPLLALIATGADDTARAELEKALGTAATDAAAGPGGCGRSRTRRSGRRPDRGPAGGSPRWTVRRTTRAPSPWSTG